MPLEEIKDYPRVIGSKQVKKAISRNEARKVFIAADAEPHIVEAIKKLCQAKEVEFEMAESMEKIGKHCRIDVGSATVALLKDPIGG